jgi:hypothetical protein
MKQDKQCTYNVTMGHAHVIIVAMEITKHYEHVFVFLP